MGRRYAVQRSNRVRLKADAAVLLNKLMFDGLLDKHRPDLADEITEMLGRLHPPTGARVVPVLTDYSKKDKKHGR